jgi:23S rRNA (cytosine1962-C5)-methyltransferase
MVDFLSLFKRARDRREGIFGNNDTNCFRLFHAGRDGFDGFTLDLYGEYLLAQLFYDEAWEYARPVRAALEEFAATLGTSIRGILLKDRRKAPDPGNPAHHESVLVAGNPPSREYSVVQNGTRCIVNLVSGQNTGLFLDMREVRERLQPHYSSIHHVLNLFCYTGIFSIHALRHGARTAVNVDLSRPALMRARNNYVANELPIDERDFICGDSFKWIKAFLKNGRRFSMVFFDPPTFSRNKGAVFSVKKHYTGYLEMLGRIAEGGYALTAINAEFLPEEEYVRYHPRSWENVFLAHESQDFMPGAAPYLKTGLWRVHS